MVADVLVELSHVFIDKTFTYKISSPVEVGVRVEVPFGKQVLEGFVLRVYSDPLDNMNLKSIIRVIDDEPVLNEELLLLGKYIKDETLCSLMSAYQCMLPLAYKAKKKGSVSLKKDKYIRLSDVDLSSYKFNGVQQKIIDILLKDPIVLKKNLDMVSSSSVKTLINKGILEVEEREVYRLVHDDVDKVSFSLNDEQREVLSSVLLDSYNTYLLYGVTGSGKTNVYMKLIERVLDEGKCAIVLVPEISLTPQIIKRFTSCFSNIAVLHSGLSDGEKYDEYRKIREGKVNIVIGARSAIFAPLSKIGVIIVDEEHSSTYKQDNNPRYNAIDIAKWRAKYHNCPLILGSATPSLESFARAEKGVYKLLTLKNRYNLNMPTVDIIDMNKEFKKSNGYFSERLISEIQSRIDKNEQVILFLNKRGYSSIVSCPSCGEVKKCPNCDISLTYHKSSNMLRCHYCGYAEKKSDECLNCHIPYRDMGMGTEKVVMELEPLINGAKIVRMDVDTTTGKNSHKNIIESFARGDYNILVGTQMIAKGLDFPNVTLVGVINADISLNFPDYRSSENTFELLNQVSGRSGRGNKHGLVLIQTFNPDHYAILYTKSNDYIGFYNEEMKIRNKLGYPPYFYICLIRVISYDYDISSKVSIKLSSFMKKNNGCIVLGPSMCNMFKVNNKYHFQIILKYKDKSKIVSDLVKINEHYFNDKSVKVEIDFNPMRL